MIKTTRKQAAIAERLDRLADQTSEARTVMRWPRAKRQEYYGRVTKARGEEAAKALAADVSAEWKKSGAAHPLA